MLKRLLTTVFVLTLVVGYGANVHAQEEQPQHKTKKTQALDPKLYNQLVKAQEFADAKQTTEALKVLNTLKARSDGFNSYEKAQLWNFYAYTYLQQDNYQKAINAYQQVLKQPNLPEGLEQQAIYSLAQLKFQVGDYQGAVNALK